MTMALYFRPTNVSFNGNSCERSQCVDCFFSLI